MRDLLSAYTQRWTGHLIQATDSVLKVVPMLEEAKVFLRTIGLPSSSCLYFDYTVLHDRILQIDEEYVRAQGADTTASGSPHRKYRNLYRVGKGEYGPDLVVDGTTGQVFALNYGIDGMPDLYVANSLPTMACIVELLYSKYFDVPSAQEAPVTRTRAIAREIRAAMRPLDPLTVTKRNSYWRIWLEEIGEGVI
jgi:hypothetical protein